MKTSIIFGIIMSVVTMITGSLGWFYTNDSWLVERHKESIQKAVDDSAQTTKEFTLRGVQNPPKRTKLETDVEKAALRNIASRLSSEVGRSDHKRIIIMLCLGVLVGTWTGVFLTHMANRRITKTLEADLGGIVGKVLKVSEETKGNIAGTTDAALQVVRKTANHIKDVFETMKHDRLYLMPEAHDDLLLSKYTFVLGKLTYLVNDGSNSLLSQVQKRNTWATEGSGITFIVTKQMGSELMTMCKKLATFKERMPDANDYTGNDLTQAFVAIIDGDHVESFPLQLVGYVKGGNTKIANWNAHTILSLLNDEEAAVIEGGVAGSKTLRHLASEIVAFLDDLVMQIAHESKGDNGDCKSVLDELIGIRMRTDQQTESLFGAFHKIIKGNPAEGKADPTIINLGRLVEFCRACSRHVECRKVKGIVEEDCFALDLVTEDGNKRALLKQTVLEEVS